MTTDETAGSSPRAVQRLPQVVTADDQAQSMSTKMVSRPEHGLLEIGMPEQSHVVKDCRSGGRNADKSGSTLRTYSDLLMHVNVGA